MLLTTHTVLVSIAFRMATGSVLSVNIMAPTSELRHHLEHPSQEDWGLERRPQFAEPAAEQEQITARRLEYFE